MSNSGSMSFCIQKCVIMFVLENRIKQLVRGMFLISRPHKVNLTGINMLKRHIVDFSKTFENSEFLKMRKKSTS